jgi:hypothetical protein
VRTLVRWLDGVVVQVCRKGLRLDGLRLNVAGAGKADRRILARSVDCRMRRVHRGKVYIVCGLLSFTQSDVTILNRARHQSSSCGASKPSQCAFARSIGRSRSLGGSNRRVHRGIICIMCSLSFVRPNVFILDCAQQAWPACPCLRDWP